MFSNASSLVSTSKWLKNKDSLNLLTKTLLPKEFPLNLSSINAISPLSKRLLT